MGGVADTPFSSSASVSHRQQISGMGNANLNAVQQVVSGCIIRAVQGVTERHRIRRTMTLEHQTTQTQQSRSVVPTVIKATFKSI